MGADRILPVPGDAQRAAGPAAGASEILAEADAHAELGGTGADPGGQVMHARFVLQWLAGDLEALPLWNVGPEDLHVTDGAAFPHKAPRSKRSTGGRCGPAAASLAGSESAPGSARAAAAGHAASCSYWAGRAEKPRKGRCPAGGSGLGRPSLYQVSLDVRRAMAALDRARDEGNPVVAARIEAMMETFLWLAGWNGVPPVDRHGHGVAEECADRDTPCACDDAGSCLRGDCPACRRAPCVHGFSQHGAA